MVNDGVGERRESAGIAEHAVLDGIEDLLELLIKMVIAVHVGMAELIDIFGEIAEEEDVVLTDLAGDFDLI